MNDRHMAESESMAPLSSPHRDAPVRHGAKPVLSSTERVRIPSLLRAMRPLQWIKNGLVLAPLLFDRHLFDLDRVVLSFAAIVAFSAVASGMYLFNDVRDAESDRHHPIKRFRPIAAGDVSPVLALATASILLVAGLLLSLAVRPAFTAVIAGYAILMVVYSIGIKQMVILDVFAIAAGFVLRAVGGAVAIAVPISPWLYVCTMLAALLIGFGKRRHELVLLGERARVHRTNLEAYSVPLLDQLIGIVAASTVMAYALYTFDAAAVPENQSMMLTLPFVIYGLFRYLYLIYRRELGGSPESLIFQDRPLLISVLGWAAASVVILYW
jgi:4-hydroxybenzoate polyprenyltransferase